MRKILKNQKGETLVETLAAILIFTMASIILYSMVTTASKVNMKARQHDEEFFTELKVAEHANDHEGVEILPLTMEIYNTKMASGAPVATKPITVKVYRQDKNSLTSYFKVTP